MDSWLNTTIFWATCILSGFIFMLSFCGFLWPVLGTVLFFLCVVSFLILAWKNLTLATGILLAELATSGKGYFFWIDTGDTAISLRIALFVVFFFVATITAFRLRLTLKVTSLQVLFSVLFIVIGIGAIQGIISFPLSAVFYDLNGWLFFALITMLFILPFQHDDKKTIFSMVFGASFFLSVFTVLLFVLFAHGPEEIVDPVYRWLRAAGIGEITHITSNMYRVFMQSQIYSLVLFVGLLPWYISTFSFKKSAWLPGLALFLLSLTLLISQSRSYWLGVIAGLMMIFLAGALRLNWSFKKIIGAAFFMLVVFLIQVELIPLLSGNAFGNVVGDRFNNIVEEPGGSSRLNQLTPLIYAIADKPLFGYGFGKTLTYVSTDPRIIAQNPDGNYTTYAFEWGYLDIVLKVGIAGLFAYLLVLLAVIYRLWMIKKQPLNLAAIGIFAGVISLTVVNVVSPYLNHPLGISLLLCCAYAALTLDQKEPQLS